jgi:hypothetical protein
MRLLCNPTDDGPHIKYDSGLAGQGVPKILWTSKAYYRAHKGQPLEPCPEPDESSPYPHTPFL